MMITACLSSGVIVRTEFLFMGFLTNKRFDKIGRLVSRQMVSFQWDMWCQGHPMYFENLQSYENI